MSFGGVSRLRKKILKIFQNICWVLCLFVCLLFCCQANSRKWLFLTTFLSWKAVYRCISEKIFFERTLEFSALSIGKGRFSRFRLLSGLTTPLFPLPITFSQAGRGPNKTTGCWNIRLRCTSTYPSVGETNRTFFESFEHTSQTGGKG